MPHRPHPEARFTSAELEASLRQLGIRELQQRLEFSPLLVDQGLLPDEQDQNMPCCVCKITDPTQLDDDGMLPYPSLGPGSDL